MSCSPGNHTNQSCTPLLQTSPRLTLNPSNRMHMSADFRKLWTVFLAFRRLAFIFLYPALLSIIPASIPGQDTNMLFIGGLFVATAIEHRGLHKRIALSVLRVVGSDPKMLMLGFMLPTWFLSMWMSNTATTAMMITIVEAVLQSLTSIEETLQKNGDLKTQVDPDKPPMLQMLQQVEQSTPNFASDAQHLDLRSALTTGVVEVKKEEHHNADDDEMARFRTMKRISIGLSLSICYSSTCGGIATITGTAPNSILFGLVNSLYGENTGLSFGSWMAYALPISLTMLLFTWFWLTLLYFGIRSFCHGTRGSKRDRMVKEVITKETHVLGEFTYAEGVCSCLFLLITLLWVTRSAGSAGWSRFFNRSGEVFVTDTQPAIVVSLMALVLPAVGPLELWRYQYQHYKDTSAPVDFSNQFLLPWHVAQKRIPWGVVFVLGGGFALSDICQSSGLSAEVGRFLGQRFSELPVMGLVLVCSVCSAALTELTSNAATASILLPIMFSLSESLKIHPFMLAFPVTVGTSFAFSLPAATPPNSIVFGKGRVKVKHMIRSGIFLNVIGSVVSLFAMSTYVPPLFGLRQLPDWAINATGHVSPVH
ncbi:Solute carrier family 13 member 2 [Fasciola hepatica]|uniref:Solute carrier family 13 member 2 n=1 Tax=Fasciola hepatica TaxID=6192 RepID=A0A4E0RRY8_FASHE|nr:Solute carrier family 13 member 2 [Fasciola hepatica]